MEPVVLLPNAVTPTTVLLLTPPAPKPTLTPLNLESAPTTSSLYPALVDVPIRTLPPVGCNNILYAVAVASTLCAWNHASPVLFTTPANNPKRPLLPDARRLKVPPEDPKAGGLVPIVVNTESFVLAMAEPRIPIPTFPVGDMFTPCVPSIIKFVLAPVFDIYVSPVITFVIFNPKEGYPAS